ncbi:hypothetical protein Acr_17g0012350 [Actinidia rufa]|uniref:S-locus lectin protein kinase family protein n=1 Tax=Actinidia rufa TaxID=165716 RepID=A0A7J0G4F3_9ERIC|nr:hypothetical protein Acr_17g0012350 [Actinidia rufa]
MRYGNLVLLEQSKTRIWSTNSSSNLANSTVATLLDNGNFVLRDPNSSNIIWQSFDYPTDTWLPGGKVGYNKLRNEKQVLSSWRSSEDPALSLFSVEVEPNSSHVLLWNGSKLYWTSGLWDGKVFANVPEIAIDYYVKNFTYISNENESYFTYEAGFPTALTRFVLDVTGQLKQFVWRKEFPTWSLFWTKPPRQCDVYAFCGAFSSCNQNVPICDCIEGFKPRTLTDWQLGDHSDGCVRKTHLECENRGNDAFVLVTNIRFPVNPEALTVGNIDKCQLVCLRNCSCTAYAYDNGCLIWGSALFSLQKLPADDKSGRNLHVRVAASELVGAGAKPKTKKKNVWIVFGAIGGFFTLFSSILVIVWRRRHKARDDTLERVEDSLVVFKFRDIYEMPQRTSQKSLGKGVLVRFSEGHCPIQLWWRRNRDSVEDEMAKYFPYRVAAKINEGEEALTTLLDTKLEGNADVVQVLEGVIEVDVHPIPRFIQGFTDNPTEPFVYQGISSSSSTVS